MQDGHDIVAAKLTRS